MYESLSGLIGGDARHDAEKFIAAESHNQVIGAKLASEARNYGLENFVSRLVATLIVDRFQTVHIDECRHEALPGAARPIDFPLEISQPVTSPASAGELIDTGQLAVAL